MTIKPSKLPEWATVGADIDEPLLAQKQIGWEADDIPPNGFLNWWWNLVYLWIQHFSEITSSFVTLEAAVAGTSVGNTCVVDEYDLDNQPGTLKTGVVFANALNSIDGSGKSVAYTQQTAETFHLVSRTDLTTVIATLTKTNAGNVKAVLTDGKFVVGAYGQFVEVWDHDTGASLWDEDHGAVVNDIAMDGSNVYFVGGVGTGTHHARARSLAAGAVVWDYDHGAVLHAVDTNGRQVFVSGVTSAFGSTADVRALDAANGFDFANEGGTGLSATDLAWDLILANNPALNGQLITDGGALFLSMTAGANGIEVRSAVDGLLIDSVPASVGLNSRLAVDNRYLFTVTHLTTDFRVAAFDKKTLTTMWLSTTIQGIDVATDGTGVFVAGGTLAANELARIYRGNRARTWRRVDTDDDHFPYRQLIIPEE